MRDELKSLEKLVADERLEQAIERAGSTLDLRREHRIKVLALKARLRWLARNQRRGLVTPEKAGVEWNRLTAAFLALLEEIDRQRKDRLIAQKSASSGEKPSVLLSYSSLDREQMLKLETALRERGLGVKTIREGSAGGGFLEQRIRRAVQQTTATFCLISERSLLSDWVTFKILRSLDLEDASRRRRFFAGYLDERFLEPAFRLEAEDEIDRQLVELDCLADAQRRGHLDHRDLDRRRDRLIQFRRGLGTILGRLRQSLVLDLRQPAFEKSVESLASALVALHRELGEDRL